MNTYNISVRREVIETYEIVAGSVEEAVKLYHMNKPKPQKQASTGDGLVTSVTLTRHLPDHVSAPVPATKTTKPKGPNKRPYVKGKYGIHNPLPANLIKEIRDLAKIGNFSYAEIGKTYGVTKQTVQNIVSLRYSYAEKLKQAA